MTVILKDTVPPIVEVAEFGYAAVTVYSLLYQSAYQDQRYDKTRCIKRRDCGETTNWSHKGIANKLHMGKQKVIECIDLLLDNGFIQLEGFMPSIKGSKHRIYRVVHPTMLTIVRDVMPILPCLPSENAKKWSTNQQRPSYHRGEDHVDQSETEDIYSWEPDGRLNDTSL
jgi:hypothetical protein